MPYRTLDTGMPTLQFNDPVGAVGAGMDQAAATLLQLGPKLQQIEAEKAARADEVNRWRNEQRVAAEERVHRNEREAVADKQHRAELDLRTSADSRAAHDLLNRQAAETRAQEEFDRLHAPRPTMVGQFVRGMGLDKIPGVGGALASATKGKSLADEATEADIAHKRRQALPPNQLGQERIDAQNARSLLRDNVAELGVLQEMLKVASAMGDEAGKKTATARMTEIMKDNEVIRAALRPPEAGKPRVPSPDPKPVLTPPPTPVQNPTSGSTTTSSGATATWRQK